MPDVTNGRLRAWNVGVGLVHLAQAIAILVLSNDFEIPVQSKVATGPPGSPLEDEVVFFDVPYAPVIADVPVPLESGVRPGREEDVQLLLGVRVQVVQLAQPDVVVDDQLPAALAV